MIRVPLCRAESIRNLSQRENREEPATGKNGRGRRGEIRANGLDVTDPRVSPLYGDLSGLGRGTLSTGTWDVFYPDTLRFAES